MIKSTHDAISILEDTKKADKEREVAIEYLQENPTDAGIAALVSSLEDDEYAVRWACSSALAALGTPAIEPVLEALAKPDNSTRLRECTRHILHYNANQAFKDQSKDLDKVLKGPSAQMSTTQEAYKLLAKQW